MKRMTVLAMAAAVLATGCETMSEDQCRKADWFERGRIDGRNGEGEGFIDKHRRACAKANIAPDDRRWRQGWAEGVRSYCVPRVAWQRGLDGSSYHGACRDFDEAVWLRWYRLGEDAYKTRSKRDAKNREIEQLEEQLKKAQKDDERKALREKIRQLDEEQAQLRRVLDQQLRQAPR
jgi:flagellar motility protein MotE (MotC chaperone)